MRSETTEYAVCSFDMLEMTFVRLFGRKGKNACLDGDCVCEAEGAFSNVGKGRCIVLSSSAAMLA